MWHSRYFHFLGEALEAVPEEQRRLGLWIVAVLAIHLAAFFFIHVSTPPSLAPAMPATHLTLYSSKRVEEAAGWSVGAASLLDRVRFWSAINDPSLPIFPPHLLDLPIPATGTVRPLWPAAREEAGTVGLEALAAQGALPDQLDPLAERAAAALAAPRPAFTYRVMLTRPSVGRTTVEWSEKLAPRAPQTWALPSPASSLLAESGVTVLRLAVDAEGRVVHVLVDESSGRSEIDWLAVEAAQALHFKQAPGASILWGEVTIFWQFQPASGP